MRLNVAGGFIREYGVGQYWFENEAYSAYIMGHCRNGRPENDDVRLSEPGPPVISVRKYPI